MQRYATRIIYGSLSERRTKEIATDDEMKERNFMKVWANVEMEHTFMVYKKKFTAQELIETINNTAPEDL